MHSIFLHRDSMLESIKQSVPEIFFACLLSNNNYSILKFGSRQILSQENIQQGDLLSPFLFCLSINPILYELSSPFTISFMDDITIGRNHWLPVISNISVLKVVLVDLISILLYANRYVNKLPQQLN